MYKITAKQLTLQKTLVAVPLSASKLESIFLKTLVHKKMESSEDEASVLWNFRWDLVHLEDSSDSDNDFQVQRGRVDDENNLVDASALDGHENLSQRQNNGQNQEEMDVSVDDTISLSENNVNSSPCQNQGEMEQQSTHMDSESNENSNEFQNRLTNFGNLDYSDTNLPPANEVMAENFSDQNNLHQQPTDNEGTTNQNFSNFQNQQDVVDIDNPGNNSQLTAVVDDGMQPSTSRGISHGSKDIYSNDIFDVEFKRIHFKRQEKFKFTDHLYNINFKSKNNHDVLLRNALDGLLVSITKVLEHLKSSVDGKLDRNLYLV